MASLTEPGKRHFLARFLSMRTFFHLIAGRLTQALKDGEDAVRAADEIGMPYGQAICTIGRIHALRLMGRQKDAWEQVERAEEFLAFFKRSNNHYFLNLTRASLFFDEGKMAEGREALAHAFRIGKEQNLSFVLCYHWQPDEMARLCAEALSAGVEVDYARDLIRRNRLVPQERFADTKDWPWPLRIHTLGRLQVLVNDESFDLTGTVQKKPLALLKTLLALGGKEVAEETVEDVVWPEAEGDMARISFKTTLSRLRKTIGQDTIEVKNGKVSLNPNLVWVDMWALESLSDRVSEMYRSPVQSRSPEMLERLSQTALDIYLGDFLASEEELFFLTARNRLRKKFERTIERCVQMLLAVGQREKAAALHDDAGGRGSPAAADRPAR